MFEVENKWGQRLHTHPTAKELRMFEVWEPSLPISGGTKITRQKILGLRPFWSEKEELLHTHLLPLSSLDWKVL